MSKSTHYTRGFVLLALVPSFVAAGGNPRSAFEKANVPDPEDLAVDEMLPASSYYALLEEMTRQLGDRQFPARAGVSIARSGLPVLRDARNLPGTICEFLVRLQIVFRQTVTNAIYELSSDGIRACIRLKRTGTSNPSTEKVDALNAAAFLTIFRDEIEGGNLAGLAMSLPDPSYMPRDILDSIALMRHRHNGIEISFPAEWLLKPIRHRWRGQGQTIDRWSGKNGNLSTISFLEKRIRLRLGNGPVLIPDLASDLGISVRQLQRSLKTSGTSYREVLARQRLDAAKHLLRTTDHAIQTIAVECGFASPQTFSRAFSNAFGQSPSIFRASGAPDRRKRSPDLSA